MNLFTLMFLAQVIMTSPLTGQIVVSGATAPVYEEVIVVQKNLVGTITSDADGNFSLDLPPGNYIVEDPVYMDIPVVSTVNKVTIE